MKVSHYVAGTILPVVKAVVTTAIRLHYDHSTTCVTTGLLHCDLNK